MCSGRRGISGDVMTKRGRGRPLKIDAEVERRILDIVVVGGSLEDAAHIVGVSPRTLRLYKAKRPIFNRGVLKAQKDGKLKLIKKVGKAGAWQAAAWMLERKYGAEFGRRETIKQEITGKNGGPIQQKTTVDFSQFSDEELLKFDQAAARGAGGVSPASRN